MLTKDIVPDKRKRRNIDKPSNGKVRADFRWTKYPETAELKVALQMSFERNDPAVQLSRHFGLEPVKRIVAIFAKLHPQMYTRLIDHFEGYDNLIQVAYDRGHKGFFKNSKDLKVVTARISNEHYTIAKSLKPYIESAQKKYNI
jgi:hypothetical protein